jgi:hypothetical protein
MSKGGAGELQGIPPDQTRGAARGEGVPDDGLRRLMTWTLIALVATVLFTGAVVLLAFYWLEGGG